MFEESKFKRLAMLEHYAPSFRKEFSELLNARALIHSTNAKNLHSLKLEQIDDYTIDAAYLNVTVRFQLFLTYKETRVVGRVICLHKHAAFEKITFDVLGGFTFDPAGNTDLPPLPHDEKRTLSGSSDEIVTAFLDQAMEFGPDKFALQ